MSLRRFTKKIEDNFRKMGNMNVHKLAVFILDYIEI